MVQSAILRLFQGLFWTSPRTTFAVNPLATILFESVRQRRLVLPTKLAWPMLAWGYLQYRWVGGLRAARGGGPGGVSRGLPDRLVTDGPYALTRNPMYLGHLIFSLALALGMRSPVAVALALGRLVYFVRRVDLDELRLERAFGGEYRSYRARVRRWIPWIV